MILRARIARRSRPPGQETSSTAFGVEQPEFGEREERAVLLQPGMQPETAERSAKPITSISVRDRILARSCRSWRVASMVSKPRLRWNEEWLNDWPATPKDGVLAGERPSVATLAGSL